MDDGETQKTHKKQDVSDKEGDEKIRAEDGEVGRKKSSDEEAAQAMEDSMQACEAELALLTDRIQQSWKDSGIQQSPEHVLGIIRQRSTDSMPGANKTEVIQDIMDEMDRILQDILTEEEMMSLKKNLSFSDGFQFYIQPDDQLSEERSSCIVDLEYSMDETIDNLEKSKSNFTVGDSETEKDISSGALADVVSQLDKNDIVQDEAFNHKGKVKSQSISNEFNRQNLVSHHTMQTDSGDIPKPFHSNRSQSAKSLVSSQPFTNGSSLLLFNRTEAMQHDGGSHVISTTQLDQNGIVNQANSELLDSDGDSAEQRHLMSTLGINQVNTDHLVIYFINGDVFHDMQSISENGHVSTEDDHSVHTDETVRLTSRVPLAFSNSAYSPGRAPACIEDFSDERTLDSRSSGRRTVSPPNQLHLMHHHQSYVNHVNKLSNHMEVTHPLNSDQSYEASISSNNQSTSIAQSENGQTMLAPYSPYENLSSSLSADSSGNEVFEERNWFDQKIKEIENIEKVISMDVDFDENKDYPLEEFAERYFSIHVREPSGSMRRTLNMARRKSNEIVPIQDMITFSKSPVINNPHIKLQHSENVNIAITIFKDITKYIRGELRDDLATLAIRGIVAYGIERIELRDEIFIQLIRQTNGNPNVESLQRAWALLCQCSVCFPPNAFSIKYILCYAQRRIEDPEVGPYARYFLSNVKSCQSHVRKMPPSSAEIEAIKNLQPLVCRIHFLDGKTKAVGVQLLDTTRDVLRTICEKIDLQHTAGWALYESTPDHDRYIHDSEYVADIMAEWEEKQRSLFSNLKVTSSPKRVQAAMAASLALTPGINYGRLIFCKRIFQHANDIPNDPTEYHLLYAQAVHYVVQIDEYAVPKSIALQLAGLQAQVIHSNYHPAKLTRYADVEEYLSPHVMEMHAADWSIEIAAAHKKYGFGKSELDAKICYLMLVTQFPLYGCTKFMVDFKGVWQHGTETVFIVSLDGIKFISVLERTLTHEFSYAQIEGLSLDLDDDYVIVELKNSVQSPLKSFVFESHDKGDIRTLIENYSPSHATWLRDKKVHLNEKLHISDAEKLMAPSNVLTCRQKLIENKILNKPVTEGLGFIRNTLRKFTRKGSESLSDSDDDSSFFKESYWSFSKTPFRQALLALDSRDHDDIAIRIFNSSLVYAGIEAAGVLEDSDHLAVVQTLMAKCMESDNLCNEFYLQLIKQTTDAPMVVSDPNNRFGIRYWQLLTMATCLMLPSNKYIFNYLKWHLIKHATFLNTEEGKYAFFSLRCLHRSYENKGRKHPPSFLEISSICKRGRISERIHFQDGQCHVIEFDSATTVEEILRIIKAKIGMKSDTRDFALYEELGTEEHYLDGHEKLADALFKWERWAQAAESKKELRFSFKKRLFVDPFVNICDAVEVDLVYHQSVTDVFEEKIPLGKQDATQLCSLRAQSEYGDYGAASHFDYSSVMRILPRHLREVVSVLDISHLHQSLIGMSYTGANLAFMDVLKNWPLFGSTVYEVSQTYTESLPKIMWLLVSQLGIHLVEIKKNVIYATFTYKEIAQYSASEREFIIVTGIASKMSHIHFSTSQGSDIVRLFEDYKVALFSKTKASCTDISSIPKDTISTHSLSENLQIEMTSL